MSTQEIHEQQIILQNLNPCSTYWVVVTAVNCGLRRTSEPRLIDLHESTPYNITFCQGENFRCRDWITLDMNNKISDIERTLSSVLTSQCVASQPLCFARSRFSCDIMDSGVVTFE